MHPVAFREKWCLWVLQLVSYLCPVRVGEVENAPVRSWLWKKLTDDNVRLWVISFFFLPVLEIELRSFVMSYIPSSFSFLILRQNLTDSPSYPGWAHSCNLPASVSQSDRITGMHEIFLVFCWDDIYVHWIWALVPWPCVCVLLFKNCQSSATVFSVRGRSPCVWVSHLKSCDHFLS